MTVEVGVNRRAGTGQSVTAAVFIVMAAGSIAVIPLLAANLDRRALGIAACVLTLVFWGRVYRGNLLRGGDCKYADQGVPSHQ